MANEKIFTQEEIENIPLPNQIEEADFHTSQSESGGISGAEKIKTQKFPIKRVAVELIGSALNTKSRKILAEFEFTEHGAMQIGKYVNGVSGDIRISPNGIVGRNISGITTFSIDADTGDAVFKGTMQAGSVMTGEIIVGNNTIIIDGDSEKPRIVFYNDNIPEIVLGEVT